MADSGPVKILGICGSLRKGSYNRMALSAAVELTPPDVTIEIFEGLRDIPPYDDDVRQQGYPEPVQKLRTAIAAADAVLFVTPEYNYSVPGVLKNAIDWASRPPDQPFNGKPMAVMGASPGMIGTARAQYHLRQSMVFLNGYVVNQPEVMIGQATQRFDADGKLTDEATRKFVGSLLTALTDWTRRLRA